MTEQEIKKRINSIAAKVTMAGQAVETATEAASAGFDPRGVWQAAVEVIDNSVRELQSIQNSELTRQTADKVRNAKVTFYRS